MKYMSLIIIGLVSHVLGLLSQDVQFKASAPNVIEVGERFQLVYTINAKPSDFDPPTFRGFNFLGGPSTAQSSNVQVINGQVTRNYSFTYTFFLQGAREGVYTIQPAKITVKGKTYNSNALKIEVVEGGKPASSGSSGNAGQQNREQKVDIGNEQLFARILVNKRDVYQGEQVIATLKLYTRLSLAGFDDAKFPSYTGFYTREIETPNQISLQRESVNGVVYNVGIIKQTILFPQRSGNITIDPFMLECIVRQRVKRQRSMFDDFFGSPYQNVKKEVTSNAVTINVKPFPTPRPSTFDGAVGRLDMDVSIDKTELPANDAITMKVKISGNGNINLIEPPVVNFPPDFEIYDPKITTSTKNTTNGTVGTKNFEYIAIPRFPGNYRVPPVEFTYFNPASGTFKTVASEEYNLNVTKSTEDDGGTVVTGLSKEDVRFIGSDIRFIKTGNISLRPAGVFFTGSFWFWSGILLPLVLFIIIVIARRNHIRRNADIARVKNRKANKLARKRLKNANGYLKKNDKEKFYEEILRACWGYLADKLNIPLAELSRERTLEELDNRGVDQETTDKLFKLIDDCEFARYAPSSVEQNMGSLYDEAVLIITKLEKQL
jgi:hypothetical protein